MKTIVCGCLVSIALIAGGVLRGSMTTVPEDNLGREKLAAWLADHLKPGANSPVFKDLMKGVDGGLMQDKIVETSLGPGLVNSEKPTGLLLLDEEFFSFEYSDCAGNGVRRRRRQGFGSILSTSRGIERRPPVPAIGPAN